MTDAEWNEAQEKASWNCGGNNCEPLTMATMPSGQSAPIGAEK